MHFELSTDCDDRFLISIIKNTQYCVVWKPLIHVMCAILYISVYAWALYVFGK